jgi:hypothetical protein
MIITSSLQVFSTVPDRRIAKNDATFPPKKITALRPSLSLGHEEKCEAISAGSLLPNWLSARHFTPESEGNRRRKGIIEGFSAH